ncbi:MAG: 3-isopropylmalate dehydratase small subunit [Acidobacteria bacterium]|nr:3-isopropylmalate dehydratase small subunit [Acidobacteriota bacterium]
MEKFTPFQSTVVALPIDNVDTDQIIPARFLKTISKDGLGDQLFNDWRYNADGSPREDFVLNRPESKQAGILLAGDNFGCGSSREHAPWALTQYGFRAVISSSFADIFKGNSMKNSLLPIVVGRDVHARLFELHQADAAMKLGIDLEARTLTLPDGTSVSFPVDEFARHCLLEGVDELGYITQQEDAIAAFEAGRVGSLNTLAG